MTDAAAQADDLAREVLSALDQGRQVPSLSARHPGLDLPSAYRVTGAVRRLREARGERVIGRKIGFTNTTIWDEYDVHAPIWGYVYDSTARELSETDPPAELAGLVEPRIEPEIMLGLGAAPAPGMDDPELLGCVNWIAHGFEIVQSLFPGWRFTPADTVAAFGLHGRLLLGPRVPVPSGPDLAVWAGRLSGFRITLSRNGEVVDRGQASNVLGGGPLSALRHLVDVLAGDADSPPLAAGEIVSTGTLTRAFPIGPGETWSTRLDGIELSGVSVRFEAEVGGATPSA